MRVRHFGGPHLWFGDRAGNGRIYPMISQLTGRPVFRNSTFRRHAHRAEHLRRVGEVRGRQRRDAETLIKAMG